MISYCVNCEQTKKDLNETKQKLAEFQNIAKKIVQTDLILRKYSDKEKECEKLAQEIRKIKSKNEDLNAENKNFLKELDGLRKQNKDYSNEKTSLEQSIKQKDELIVSLSQKETDYEQKLNLCAQKERLLENNSKSYLKQIEDLRNELKILNEKYEKTVELLNLASVREKPNFISKNIRTSTQILNVNFEESSENVQVPENISNKETTFYLGSESENDEKDIKPTLKINNVNPNDTDSMNLSSTNNLFSDQPQSSEQNLARDESNSQVSAKKSNINSFVFSSSESESESSTSSSSSTSSAKSKSKKVESEVFNTNELFGSELSDEESDLEEDKSIDITNIQEEYAKVEQNTKSENVNFENLIELSTIQCLDNVLNNVLGEMIELSIAEQLVLELISDEIFYEEISSRYGLTPNILRDVCINCIEIEKIEKKNWEENVRNEIKSKLEEEICEKIFDEKFNQLILECSQRVIAEEKNEQIESICGSLVDQVCTDIIENCLIEFIIDDMTCAPKPLLEKISFKIENDLAYRFTSKRSFPSDFSPIEEKKEKRSRRESGGSESSCKSSLILREDNDKKTLEEFVKECLAEYFRKFNLKVEFTFEELDELIDRLAQLVEKNTIVIDKSKFVAQILIKHYLNNKFIPLDDNKLNQVDDSELKMFRQINMIFNAPFKQEFNSITKTPYGTGSTQSSYTNYLQIRLNEAMTAKITNEEEKYVYILNKLVEYPTLESVQFEFLNYLKTLILSNEFQNTFKMKMGRMLCFICKSRKNYDYLKCFMCDLIISRETSMPLHFQNMILSFARMWPECLTWPCSIDQVNDEDIDPAEFHNPILFVLMHIVKKNIFKNNIELEKAKFSKYYLYILESLCNWNFECNKSIDILTLLKTSIEKAFESCHYFKLDDKIFCLSGSMLEHCEAFKLLCLDEDWTWTKQNFIEKFINKEFDHLENILKDISVSNNDILTCTNKYAVFLISLANVISVMCPDQEYAWQILSQIENKLESLDTVFINYELALVESVVLLSRFDINKCLNLIHLWYEKFKIRTNNQNLSSNLPQSIKLEIGTIQSLYKEKIDQNVKIISF